MFYILKQNLLIQMSSALDRSKKIPSKISFRSFHPLNNDNGPRNSGQANGDLWCCRPGRCYTWGGKEDGKNISTQNFRFGRPIHHINLDRSTARTVYQNVNSEIFRGFASREKAFVLSC